MSLQRGVVKIWSLHLWPRGGIGWGKQPLYNTEFGFQIGIDTVEDGGVAFTIYLFKYVFDVMYFWKEDE